MFEDADIVVLARQLAEQLSGEAEAPWDEAAFASAARALVDGVTRETSPFRLGEVLRADVTLDLPVEVVKATYERLLALGVTDVHTRLCFARYLLLHGPEWDDRANAELAAVEAVARAAGLWESSVLGHHPVFYSGTA